MTRRVLVIAACSLLGVGVVWYCLTHRLGDWLITIAGPDGRTTACFRTSGTILATDLLGGSVSWRQDGTPMRFPKDTVHAHAVFDGNWKAALKAAGVEDELCRNGVYPDPAVMVRRAAAAAEAEARRVQEIERMAPATVDLGAPPSKLCEEGPHGGCTDRTAVHRGSGKAVLRRRPDGLYMDGHRLVLYESARQVAQVTGAALKDEMLGRKVVNANVLDALVAHPELVPDEWRTHGHTGRDVVFWGTLYKDFLDQLFVRYGNSCAGDPAKWCSSYFRLDNPSYRGSAVVIGD